MANIKALAIAGVAVGAIVAVVKLMQAITNFVAAHLGWTISGAVLLLLLILWIRYKKNKYIGEAKGEGVDPLLTKAAKYVVKKKDKLGSKREEIVHSLSDKFQIDETRANLLFLQLEYSDVLRKMGEGSSYYEFPAETLWDLHDTFAGINRSEDYFKEKITARIEQLGKPFQEQADKQAEEWQRQLLLALKCNISLEVALPYYNLLLAAETTLDAVELAKREISSYKSKEKYIGITYSADSLRNIHKLYEDLSLWLEEQSGTNSSAEKNGEEYYQRLHIALEPFKGITVNGEEYKAPDFLLKKDDLYLFPSFGISFNRYSESQPIRILDYKNMSATILPREISGDSSFDVSEAEFIRTEWEHPRLDGGPDGRYSENASEDFYRFYAVIISGLGLNLICSRNSVAGQICQDFMTVFKSSGPEVKILEQI